MNRFTIRIVCLLATGLSSPALSAPIVGGETIINGNAIQSITLLPASGLVAPGTTDAENTAEVFGQGLLALNRNSQIRTTIEIPSLTGVFSGASLLGRLTFGTLTSAGRAAFSGSITGVDLDATDPGFAAGNVSAFERGDYQVSGDFFEIDLLDLGRQWRTGPVTFRAEFDGLPPSPGTIISGGDQRVDIFEGTTLVAYSTNRQILVTAVPEPASGLLIGGMLSTGILACRRKKSRSDPAGTRMQA